jgi:hypothetical protein
MTYRVGDDASYTAQIIDRNAGTIDLPITTVTAWKSDGTTATITGAAWAGPTTTVGDTTVRNLRIPLSSLPAGLWGLGLPVDGDKDLFLANVVIQ